MSLDDLPPSYAPELLAYCDLPEYSPTPTDQDRLLPWSNTIPTHPPSQHTYSSKTFSVTLGEKLWGLDIPAYGYDATIQGSIELYDLRVSQVSIELQGWVATSRATADSIRTPLCSKAKTKVAQSLSASSRNIGFSLPIPHEIEYIGQKIPTPASQCCRTRDTEVCVNWELNVHVSRRGLRTNDKYKIPILYLPKSRPLGSHLVDFPPCLSPQDERIRVIELPLSKPDGIEFEKVTLTLPSTRSFTAGCRLPICITVFGKCTAQIQNRQGASFMEALCSSTSVTLVKQTSIFNRAGANMITSESRVSYVQEFEILRLSLDQAQLKAWLYAGACGKEMTSSIPGIVRIKYLLKIASKPTSEIQQEYSVPTFNHVEEIELTTDPWGTSEWELRATHGVPIPALGLASASSDIDTPPSQKQA